MALSFKSVFVEFSGIGPDHSTLGTGLARWGGGVKIHAADVAIKAFHIGYVGDNDHNFGFERIALHNVFVQDGDVHFEVFMKIKDDTDDINKFKGAVEALVIADVDFP